VFSCSVYMFWSSLILLHFLLCFYFMGGLVFFFCDFCLISFVFVSFSFYVLWHFLFMGDFMHVL